MSANSQFVFEHRAFNPETREAVFTYNLLHNGETISFEERVVFPDIEIKTVLKPLLDRLLDDLHLILGVSYWKTYAPQQVELPHIMLSKHQAEFWNTLYTYGMGEFYYTNTLNFHNYVQFPYDETYVAPVFEIEESNKILIGVSGGKDSIVTAELMKKSGRELTAFAVENEAQGLTNDEVVKLLGLPSLKIKRKLDSKLKTLSGSYKGHIPISAVYAFLGVTAAILYGYKYVVASNEHSSNYGNVEYLGVEVNHQWSKSSLFENLFQKYVQDNITPDVTYFSLLRPFTELKIVHLFSKYPRYFHLFTSCNRNYRMDNGVSMPTLWCGECAKCAFAFVMLAAFLSEQEVLKIFGKNMFEDENLLDLYRELLGTKNSKPLDCVGTPDEVSTAFTMAKEKGNFVNTPVMKMFDTEVLSNLSPVSDMQHRLFEASHEHSIPSELLPVIENL